jgi:hypothetical protein
MSTNNLARFYWAKLERATAILEVGKPEGARDIFLQLADDFECPRYVHDESQQLAGTDNFPDSARSEP